MPNSISQLAGEFGEESEGWSRCRLEGGGNSGKILKKSLDAS